VLVLYIETYVKPARSDIRKVSWLYYTDITGFVCKVLAVRGGLITLEKQFIHFSAMLYK